MKKLTVLALVIMGFSLSQTNAQVASSHRGQYPRLLENGNVVDMNGRKLGSITQDGQVMVSSDKLIALISATGEVTYANGKGVAGTIRKNVFTASNDNYIATLEPDGAVMLGENFAAFVDAGYPSPRYACILHFFFGRDNQVAREVDALLY